MIIVTIIECDGEYRRWVHSERTTNPTTAVRRAVWRHFGEDCYFRADKIGGENGYIRRLVKKDTSISVTELVCVRAIEDAS